MNQTKKIKFSVSAKTARLIGRENISTNEGALIELIKNAYDADATCIEIIFDIPFLESVKKINSDTIDCFNEKEIKIIKEYYDKVDDYYFFKKEKMNDFYKIEKILNDKNRIIIADNGHGMTYDVLCNEWMDIGTSNKEKSDTSPSGRVKTGAKGIGRFALDKLSFETTLYTKAKNDNTYKWSINWNQFENADHIDEITATITEIGQNFKEKRDSFFSDVSVVSSDYLWDTGTIIILKPIRVGWNETSFEGINKSLKTMFPRKNKDDLDVYIYNKYYSKYDFYNNRFFVDNISYDYMIKSSFKQDGFLEIKLYRNEVDIKKRNAKHKLKNGEVIELDFSDFWSRDFFSRKNQKKEDYGKTIRIKYKISELFNEDYLNKIGPFTCELYYIKNTNSSTEILKKVNSKERKKILDDYSGVKIYRDGFRVRPYGEEDGPSYDWLKLSIRTTKSPAAASHDSGQWKVRLNQLIGEIRITKKDNPYLSDMANRESLETNDSYEYFVDVIVRIIETFEQDRQSFLREYASWIKSLENGYYEFNKITNAKKNNENIQNNNDTEIISSINKKEDEYVKQILFLKEKINELNKEYKSLLLYSSTGMVVNNFAHEISAIDTIMTGNISQLSDIINYYVKIDDRIKGSFLDPNIIIEDYNSKNKLLNSWLSLVINKKNELVFLAENHDLVSEINSILENWSFLLEEKKITVSLNPSSNNIYYYFSKIDLVIIINNLLINSVWFLGKTENNKKKQVEISVIESKTNILIEFYNNGPSLSKKYIHNPNKIFEPNESSKNEYEDSNGTGLGLWICKLIIENIGGLIYTDYLKEGFIIKIELPK